MLLSNKRGRPPDAIDVRGGPENSFGPLPCGRKAVVLAPEKGVQGSGLGRDWRAPRLF
jgi:hypothetical protein